MEFNLEKYLSESVERIIKNAILSAVSNPKESIFLSKFSVAAKKAQKNRNELENSGVHIPPFLIASITTSCNLHCAGCFARANNSCMDKVAENQLTADDWKKVFSEAVDLGICFILLAGGEPLLRMDVIKAAAAIPKIAFPVITNGTLIDDIYADFFDSHRNIIPIISIEGHKAATDKRRGSGMYNNIFKSMNKLYNKKLMFGVSVTQTTENTDEIFSDEFVGKLNDVGVAIIFYIEYVPVTEESRKLALTELHREITKDRLKTLREKYKNMIIIAFPGDEEKFGGCLAAGRGFFHINSHGGAEPCPFAPFNDSNVKEGSLLKALSSPLFQRVRESDELNSNHSGGCALFGKEEAIKQMINV